MSLHGVKTTGIRRNKHILHRLSVCSPVCRRTGAQSARLCRVQTEQQETEAGLRPAFIFTSDKRREGQQSESLMKSWNGSKRGGAQDFQWHEFTRAHVCVLECRKVKSTMVCSLTSKHFPFWTLLGTFEIKQVAYPCSSQKWPNCWEGF